MSRMAKSSAPRRPKRVYDAEFKAQAVRLVIDEGKSAHAVARGARWADVVAVTRIAAAATIPAP